MNKQSKWILGAAVVALSGALTFSAVAHDGFHHGYGKRGQAELAEKLNLTAEQKQQWADTQKAFHEQNKDFMQQARQTMQEFRAAKESGDTAKADSLKPTVEANRAQMKSLRDAQNQKLMSILNDQQKAQFQEMLSKRQQHERQ